MRQTEGTAGARILAFGGYQPARVVTNDELAATVDTNDEWIRSRVGIASRRIAGPDETVADMAVQAGGKALAASGLSPEDIDLVIVATCTPEAQIPNTAATVARRLGINAPGAYDMNAACAGFCYALANANDAVRTGTAGNVLVIGAEVLTRFIDYEDRRTAPLFADGAGALVLCANAPGQIGPFVLGSDGGAANAIRVTRERGVLEMEGHETFLMAVEKFSRSTVEVLELAGLGLADVDLFVYHQANSRILTAVAERLELPRERVFDCIAGLGNTSAASVPIALTQAVRDGTLEPGMRVVLGAVGAGLVWGTTVLTWGEK